MNENKLDNFDCLKFKYEIQEKIYNEIKNLSPKDEIAYFNNAVKEGSFKHFAEILTRNDKEILLPV
ncbi:MAG: hypothetical protein V1779_03675 [bacterium]